MPVMEQEAVERTTVYLTSQNRQRLRDLRRGEKTKKINEALDRIFAEEEKKRAFEEFMQEFDALEPVVPSMPSVQATRLLRTGRDHDVADKRK